MPLGFRILLGHSRKSFLIQDNDSPKDRLSSTLAISTYAFMKKIDIIRVHDVFENKKVMNVITKLIK